MNKKPYRDNTYVLRHKPQVKVLSYEDRPKACHLILKDLETFLINSKKQIEHYLTKTFAKANSLAIMVWLNNSVFKRGK